MSKRIKIGSRVSTEAWRFDQTKEDSDRWSLKQFGETWQDARLYGTVVETAGEKWKIKWEIDGETSMFETDNLFKESECSGKYLFANFHF